MFFCLFGEDFSNFVEFWCCPSNSKWMQYKEVNKHAKQINVPNIFPSKTFFLLWQIKKTGTLFMTSFHQNDSKGKDLLMMPHMLKAEVN